MTRLISREDFITYFSFLSVFFYFFLSSVLSPSPLYFLHINDALYVV